MQTKKLSSLVAVLVLGLPLLACSAQVEEASTDGTVGVSQQELTTGKCTSGTQACIGKPYYYNTGTGYCAWNQYLANGRGGCTLLGYNNCVYESSLGCQGAKLLATCQTGHGVGQCKAVTGQPYQCGCY